MDLQLAGKGVLVTGGAGGVGRGICEVLAEEGCVVAVHGRDAAASEAVAASIRRTEGRARAIAGELANDDDAAAVFEQATRAAGAIEILVHCVGSYQAGPWQGRPAAQWAASLDANLLTLVRIVQQAVPAMRGRQWGRIIAITSCSAERPDPLESDYGAAKAAARHAVVSLAKGLAGSGITANAISPGPVYTAGLERSYRAMAPSRGWGDKPSWPQLERHIVQEDWPNPAGRIARPDDVASAVAFLASPRAGFINGTTLLIDGGGTGSL
jgi:NAD(P)-dependent dehydrogenase (short-subunit alcohol dehydrogenase family)